MLKPLALVLALSAVFLQVAHAEPAHAIDVIDKENLSLFKALADLSGVTKPLSAKEAKVTVLAPTNAAIEAFLKDMGLTIDDLKKNEALVDRIVAYHIIMGQAGSTDIFAKGDKVKVATASSPYNVVFSKANGGVVVTDFQGNTATVSKANIKSGNAIVHVVDKVLYSGAYWTTLAKLVKVLPDTFSTLAAAADAAGLVGTLSDKDFTDTVFLPTNQAFKAAGVSLDAPAATLTEVLMYHVVPGDHSIPLGFTNGEPVKTLEGQTITVTATKNADGSATAFVTDAMGKKVKVIHPNLFIGKAEGHVIDGVLMPKIETAAPAAATTTAVAAPAAATTTAAPAPAAAAANPSAPPAAATSSEKTVSKPAGIVSWIKSFITFKPPQKDTVSVTVSLPSGKGGRKLMQGASTSASFAPTIVQDSSSQAILNAVNTVAAGGSAYGATQATLNNGLLLTSYPTDATYSDGIANSGYGAGGN